MSLCKNCTHWRRGAYLDRVSHLLRRHAPERIEVVGETAEGNTVGLVTLLESSSPQGLCLHPSVDSEYMYGWLHRKPVGDNAGIVCEGYDSCHYTGENFGCIHFQAK